MKMDEPYLLLIRDSIEQVFEYIGDSNREMFLQNDMLKDACLTRLIVIGECSTKISEALKTKFPDIEWNEMKAARNFYVHVYGHIN